MKAKLSILFYAKRAKTTKDGLIPIYMRVTVDGKRIEFSTQRCTVPEKWSAEGSCMKGASAEAKTINTYLDTLKAKVYEHQQELIREGKILNAENMKNKIFGVEKQSHMLVPIFQKHNDEMKALIGKEFAVGTYKRYRTSIQHVVDFLKWKYKVSDIDIREIDHDFLSSYEFYLKSKCECQQNAAVKHLRNLKKIISTCIANNWIDRDPFFNYKLKTKEVDRGFLTQDEVNSLLNKEISNQRIAQVKDIFLFSCYTGLSYSDVEKLTTKNIGIGVDGQKWIFIKRTKNNNPSNIPLLPIAEFILEKYKDNPKVINEGKLLPVCSNQKTNVYLKEIADICGINKVLTFHLARHTFATTITLTNGIPIETVSKMLGHKSLKTTQHYAKILDKKIGDDMRVLREKFSPKIYNKKANSF